MLIDLERLCDLRKIGFLLQVLADPAENDAVRIHALRWFRCGNCAPAERRRVAEAIRRLAADRVNPGVRVNAVLEGGRLVRVDEAAVLAEAQRLAEAIGPASAEDFWQVDGASARLMRSDRL